MQISLCIVVRNEASLVASAIGSARPVVDEIVVVDTGSSDGTQAAARAAGARVLEHEWPGDLGAAHALPVAHAHGDWILALDADEVLDPLAREQLRELVSAAECDAYELPVRNYQYSWPMPKWRPANPADARTKGAIGFVPTHPIRLFRRRPEYTYAGRLHQTLKPSVLASGGRIGRAEIPIHHYGFLRFDRDKTDFYVRLARRHAEDRPDDPRAWIDFGITLVEQSRLPAAAAAFRRAHALGDRADAAFHLGSLLADLGRAGESFPLLREAIRGNPRDECSFYDRADAWEALGVACDVSGRGAAAEGAYRTALELRNDSPAAMNNLAALLAQRGDFAEAKGLADELVARYRGSSTAWSTLGLIQLRLGDLDAARRSLETAVELGTGNVVALMNLGLTHTRAGHPRRATRAYAAAREWLGTVQTRRTELEKALPKRHRRPPPPRLRAHGPGLVAAVIHRLEGGAGRVLADGLLALEPRPRLVVCLESGVNSGLRLREELESAGVEVVSASSEAALGIVLRRARPSVVLHHWWNQNFLRGPLRIADERWVCIGHIALPMPLGYDAYVVLSAFHGRLQQHLPQDRVVAIPNGVDPARFADLAAGTERRPVTIAMLSRLEAAKFPANLLEYLPPLDGARVLIAGMGGRRYEIEPELAERGLMDSVRFVGAIRSTLVPSFLADADIGLHLTELSEEVWGMSVLEMLAAGLPVVAEPKGNLPDLVADGRNGFLASAPTEVASRLRELIDSPKLRERMGAESRRAVARFDLEKFSAKIRKLVDAVEQRPAASSSIESRPRRWRGRSRGAWGSRFSYLVCATPRSGSTLLCEALTNTGLAGEPGEVFEDQPMRSLPSLLGAADLHGYLEELFVRTATPNAVFGAKVSYDGLQRLVGGPGRSSLSDAFPEFRYVFIRRSDKLRQAVSWERALQTGVWSSAALPPPIAIPKPRFDRTAIEARLAEIERLEAAFEHHFAAAAIRPVRVTYEELVPDYEGTALRVLRELGIETPDPIWFGPRRLARLADAESDEWVARYAAGAPRRSKRREQTAPVS